MILASPLLRHNRTASVGNSRQTTAHSGRGGHGGRWSIYETRREKRKERREERGERRGEERKERRREERRGEERREVIRTRKEDCEKR